MDKKELLASYRARVIELEELQHQLDRIGTDGRPSACHAARTDRHARGTNDPSAAAMQLADGLEALADRKRAELRQLFIPIEALLKEITDFRTYMIVQHYYVLAETDEQIGRLLAITRVRANQLRLQYLKKVG